MELTKFWMMTIHVPTMRPPISPMAKGIAMEPMSVKAKKDNRQSLDNPDATEKLKVDGISCRQEQDKGQCTKFDHQGDSFCATLDSSRSVHVGRKYSL